MYYSLFQPSFSSLSWIVKKLHLPGRFYNILVYKTFFNKFKIYYDIFYYFPIMCKYYQLIFNYIFILFDFFDLSPSSFSDYYSSFYSLFCLINLINLLLFIFFIKISLKISIDS